MKLHGSLNWARCVSCNQVVPWFLEDYFRKYSWDLWGREIPTVRFIIGSRLGEFSHCQTPTGPEAVIVPPTWNKTQYHQEIPNVWAAAAANLSDAENIFVIGYSLAETDQFFRYLYALGAVGDTLLKRFWVFDPDPSGQIEGRFASLLGANARGRFRAKQNTFTEAIRVLRAALSVSEES